MCLLFLPLLLLSSLWQIRLPLANIAFSFTSPDTLIAGSIDVSFPLVALFFLLFADRFSK
jgi:hypothetical protein